jgi:hypothetical protein
LGAAAGNSDINNCLVYFLLVLGSTYFPSDYEKHTMPAPSLKVLAKSNNQTVEYSG